MRETGNKMPNLSAGASAVKKKRRFPLSFQLILVLAFLAFVYFSFFQNVLSSPTQGDVPGSLGQLKLVSNTKGSEALAQVSRLHGTEIKLAEASILKYAHKDPYHNSDEKLTVWIGKAETSDAAAQLMQRMTAGIARGGGSGFSNLQKVSVGGQEVLKVDGPGGNHYFYIPRQSRERIIWLTIENASDPAVLELAVKAF